MSPDCFHSLDPYLSTLSSLVCVSGLHSSDTHSSPWDWSLPFPLFLKFLRSHEVTYIHSPGSFYSVLPCELNRCSTEESEPFTVQYRFDLSRLFLSSVVSPFTRVLREDYCPYTVVYATTTLLRSSHSLTTESLSSGKSSAKKPIHSLVPWSHVLSTFSVDTDVYILRA